MLIEVLAKLKMSSLNVFTSALYNNQQRPDQNQCGQLLQGSRGIITQQCVDKNAIKYDTFLETIFQRLLDDLISVEKGFGVHVQRMLKSRGLYNGGNFGQNTWKKAKENWGPYSRS